MPRRLFRKAVQQGRSERRGEAYSGSYVEPLSEARTPLAGFVNSLLVESFLREEDYPFTQDVRDLDGGFCRVSTSIQCVDQSHQLFLHSLVHVQELDAHAWK